MKTELLASLDALDAASASTRALVSTLPDDPAPPNAPTNFVVGEVYGTNQLSIPLSWDVVSGGTAELDVKAAEGNPNGPQDWQSINLYATPTNATYVLNSPADQVLLFRVRQALSGLVSDYAYLTFTANDYL